MQLKKLNMSKSIFIIPFFLPINIFAQDYPTIPDAQFTVPEKRDFKLNESILPCNNFYKFVCSNEMSQFKLPQSKSRYVFSFNDSAEKITKKRLSYINSILVNNELPNKVKMIKNFYNSCTNIDARKAEEINLLNVAIQEIFSMNRQAVLSKFTEDTLKGNSSLVNIEEMDNISNPKIKDIIFTYNLPLKVKEYYNNNDMTNDYKILISFLFDELNITNSEAKADFILRFEKAIASQYPTKSEMRELETKDNTVQRKFLLFKYPALNFNKILQKIPADVNLNLILTASYSQMNSMLQKASLEELQALLLWNTLSNNIIVKYSHPNYYGKYREFKLKYNGISKIDESIEKQCVQETVSAMERNLDYEVVKQYYSNFPTDRIKNIVEKVQHTTLNNIKNNNWLSPTAKEKAILKIEKIRFQVVKPENLKDWDIKDVLSLYPDQFQKNKQIIRENDFNKLLLNILKPVNDLRWDMSPLTVNAYYNPTSNQFVMPMGILQPPFFDESKSDTINMGSVGMVVAHEIGHSIDDQGSNYDEKGRLSPWMSNSDLDNFKLKTQKIVTLFDHEGIDGKLTLGENIADFVGLQNSYQSAFFNGSSSTKQEQKEFFIQYAKTWCGVIQPKYREFMIKTDPHSPIDLRVNGQMKLSKQFEDTFMCKKGENMTLPDSERVTLW
ncbi:M13 family metallopeptidase [Pigmentibacter sp. JX0631]|uniref:M13 family metallopeptidase n=1 Tax=Pigmentibacter sp. JX0631 TaxID=2976982 RepID=UPI0024695C08|nr:M13 family metallopeptidase [Pigmentibacter sp. JX0631]WGL60911.1 M13 family metallopeptidase [Pigmentibacter sp. JX0631]